MRLKAIARSVLPTGLWARLRTYRLRREVARYRRRRVRHVYGGHPLEIELSDPMAQGWYDQDWPLQTEIALLRQHGLRPGARVFDVGAHQGVVALMLAREVGPTGSVVAVEASPHNARAARVNRDLNAVGWLQVVHAAVAAREGTLTFNEGLNGQVDDGAGAWGRIEVPARTVDGLAREFGPPDVLFIDVEGFECEALRGATETLARRPDCFVEVHGGSGLETFGGSVEAVVSFFPRDAYDLYASAEELGRFDPLGDPSPLAGKRFFLVAIHRRPPADPPRPVSAALTAGQAAEGAA